MKKFEYHITNDRRYYKIMKWVLLALGVLSMINEFEKDLWFVYVVLAIICNSLDEMANGKRALPESNDKTETK